MKKSRKILIVTLSILIVMAVSYFEIGIFFYDFALKPKKIKLSEEQKNGKENN